MESDHEKEKIERLRRAMYSRELSDKFKQRERRALGETPELVGEDWKHLEPGSPGTLVAPRGITLVRSILYWLLGVAIVFFVGAVFFFTYYFTLGSGSLSASANNVDIIVSGPAQVAGGEPTELQVAITNRNRVPLELSELVVTYPDGTRSVNDLLTALPSVRQDLATIQPGETKQGVINAIFTGQEGQHENVKVELEYHLSGSSAIFVASSQYALVFGSAPLTISVEGNTSSISGQPVSMVVTVASNANTTVRDVVLRADYPFGFKFSSATPAAVSGGLWRLGDFAPGQKKTISINGTMLGETNDDKVFNFTAGERGTASSSPLATQFAAYSFHVAIAQPFLGLTLSVNGSSGPNAVLSPSDTAVVTLNYKNNLSTQITNAVIVARLSGIEIDGTSVQSTDGFYRSTDGVMLWDKSTTNGKLASVAPGQGGNVAFSFKIPDPSVIKSISDPHIDISVNAAGDRVSESGAPQSLQSATIQHIALASDLQLSAQALYYQNPFGTVGPMPPQAGKETNYAIVLTIKNTTNRIVGAKVTATLPPYVRWIGSHAPAYEDLAFNPNSSMFTWDVGEIEPNIGLNGTSPRQIAIAIGFDPSTSQIGQQPVLIQGVLLTGTDEATGARIKRATTPEVTTNLIQISKSSSEVSIGTDKGFNPSNATVIK